MSDNQADLQVMFYQLVLSLQASTMQYLGKVMSPVSGEIERNMDAARYAIDTLEMLQHKTTGNLTDDEKKMLDHVLYQLRMNYVEELKKPEAEESGEKPAADPEPAGPETGGEPEAPGDESTPSPEES